MTELFPYEVNIADSNMYPVIHPAYQNTLVGKVISMLDYYMKGFLNGAFYDESFVKHWQTTKTQDKKVLKANSIDVHDYCRKHLGDQYTYYSIREHLEILQSKFLVEKSGITITENPILSDYSGFKSSFRIIAKENSIKKTDSLFELDGDFNVFYTIEPDPAYADELRKYRAQFHEDPAGYTRLKMAYDLMQHQIKTIMPRLPVFKELFEQLKVINFFSYYFKTLKQAQKIPSLSQTSVNPIYSCPPLFPHLPIRKMKCEKVDVDFLDIIEKLSESDKKVFNKYLEDAASLKELPQNITDLLNPGFRKQVQTKIPFALPENADSLEYHKKVIHDYLRGYSKQVKATNTRGNGFLHHIEEALKLNEENLVVLDKNIQQITEEKEKLGHEESINPIFHNDSLTEVRAKFSKITIQRKREEESANISKTILKNFKETGIHPFLQNLIIEKLNASKEIKDQIYDIEIKIIEIVKKREWFWYQKETIRGASISRQHDIEEFERKASAAPAEGFFSKFFSSIGTAWFARAARQSREAYDSLQKQIPTYEKAIEEYNQEKEQLEVPLKELKLKLSQIEEEFKKQQETSFNPIAYYCKETPLTFMQTAAQIQFYTDQPEEENEQDKRIVGGCGLTLANQSLEISLKAPSILHQQIFSLHGDETLQPVFLGNKVDGHVFSMHFVDFPTAKDSEYGWMNQLLTREENQETQLKLQLVYAIHENDKKTFLEFFPHLLQLKTPSSENGKISVLHAAAHSLDSFYLEEFHRRRSDITIPDTFGCTALHHAAKSGSLANVKLLLSECSHLLNQPAKNNTTPLYVAIQNGKEDVIDFLLRNGADVNIPSAHGMTPLYCAIHHGFEKIALTLIRHGGFDPNKALEDGTTPLHLAVEVKMVEVVKELLQRGALSSIARKDSYMPIHIAVQKGSPKILSLLLNQKDIKINVQLRSGKTALHLAAEKTNPEFVYLLLQKGADLSLFGWDKESVLLSAVRSGNLGNAQSIINEYIKRGKESCSISLLDHRDSNGTSPLDQALIIHFQGAIKLLLQHGAAIQDKVHFLNSLCSAKANVFDISAFIDKNNFTQEELQKAL